MKQYYTLIQGFNPEHRKLEDYLEEQGIKFQIGADFAEDLLKAGHVKPKAEYGTLMKKYTVLVEEHELSAIRLSIDGIEIVENRPGIKFQNTVRGYFSWILD